MAVLLDGLPESGPLYAPNVNSYKRFTPSACAPVTFSWGHDNLTCAIRVVGRGLILEDRVPGADDVFPFRRSRKCRCAAIRPRPVPPSTA